MSVTSKQFEIPSNDNQVVSGRDVNATIVDSGIRRGKSIWQIYIKDNLITGNTFTCAVIVGAVTTNISVPFNTDNDTTVGDINTAIAAVVGVSSSAVTTKLNTKNQFNESFTTIIEVIGKDNVNLKITGGAVSGGASQSDVEVRETTALDIVAGLNTLNEDSVEALRIDEVSAALSYIGYALPGSDNADPVWKIAKISVSGTVTTIQYADSNKEFDNVWDDRASLTYG